MQFSTSFIIAALPFLIAASRFQPKPRAAPLQAYTLVAINSGDQVVQNQPINAVQNAFYIDNGPGTVCPAGVTCPAGTDTSITVANSIASLNVDVPAGQQLYVSHTGALLYTAPHSRTMPTGATSTGFTTSSPPSTNGTVSNLIINGIGSSGWLACPHVETGGTTDYEIFANVTGVQVSGTSVTHCHDIAIALLPEKKQGASAYQYS